VLAPLTVSVVAVPAQIGFADAIITTGGLGFTVTIILIVAVQPNILVTVSETE
jgi:hypothetical protein